MYISNTLLMVSLKEKVEPFCILRPFTYAEQKRNIEKQSVAPAVVKISNMGFLPR